MGTSELSEHSSGDIVSHRVAGFLRILNSIRQKLQEANIPGRAEKNFKELVLNVVVKLEEEIKGFVEEISSVEDINIKMHRSYTIHRILEEFLYEVDTITGYSTQIPLEMHCFIEYVLAEIGFSDLVYLLLSARDLSATNLSFGLRRLFSVFPDTQGYIELNRPFLWAIFLPPSLIGSTMDWPLVVHELGHILEDQKWRIVDDHYPLHSSSDYLEQNIKYLYAKEFQADCIATTYFGRIFPVRTLLNYYRKEIRISPTHPAWSERLDAMEERLNEMGLKLIDYKSLYNLIPSESSLVSRDRIEHLSRIIEETLKRFQEHVYHDDENAQKRAMRRLVKLAPYTEDIRVLLNVADEAKERCLRECENDKDREKIKRAYENLLVDSIRLTYLRKVFRPIITSLCS